MGVRPRFVYTGAVASGVSQKWVADLSRLRALGYQPPTSLADGLLGTADWFRRDG